MMPRAISGYSSSSASNSARGILRTLAFVVASIDAERGPPSSRAISPKTAPRLTSRSFARPS